MTTRVISLAWILALIHAAYGCGGAPRSDRLRHVRVPAPSLAGSVLPNDVVQPGIVYLPPSYDSSPDRRFPVVYYLPGFTTAVAEYVDGSISGFRMDGALDRAIADRRIPEAILVIVNGRNGLGGSFYVDSPVTGNWERYVVEDVVRYVDRGYRTLARPEARGITGDSMGGFGALHLAMRHSDVFGAVYAISPGLFDERGLEDQGMFSRKGYVKAFEIQQGRMSAWPRDDAPRRFESFVGELYAAGGRFNHRRGFLYAYGAAFAPEPGAGAPFLAEPFPGGGVSASHDGRERHERSFDGWTEKVARHGGALRSLRGIEVEVAVHEGGHVDRLGERIEDGMIPFFARVLDTEAAGGVR